MFGKHPDDRIILLLHLLDILCQFEPISLPSPVLQGGPTGPAVPGALHPAAPLRDGLPQGRPQDHVARAVRAAPQDCQVSRHLTDLREELQ